MRVVTSDDLAFIGIFSVMTALLAAYVWLRVVHTPRLEGRLRRVVTRVIVTASLSMPGALIVARTLPRPWDRLLQLPVYVWVGLVVVGFFLCLGAEPLRLAIAYGVRGAFFALASVGALALLASLAFPRVSLASQPAAAAAKPSGE